MATNKRRKKRNRKVVHQKIRSSAHSFSFGVVEKKEKTKISIASSAPTVSFSTNIGLVITLILMSSASVHYGKFYIDTPTAVAAAAAARINNITAEPNQNMCCGICVK